MKKGISQKVIKNLKPLVLGDGTAKDALEDFRVMVMVRINDLAKPYKNDPLVEATLWMLLSHWLDEQFYGGANPEDYIYKM